MMELFFQDFSAIQIAGLILCAFLIGVNKTGIPGIGTLPVVILSLLYPAKFSTGLQLILLCTGDVIATLYYHRTANWKLLFKMLPCALVGIVLGSLTLHMLDERAMGLMIGVILILLSGFHFVRMFCRKHTDVPPNPLLGMAAGLIGGFTTQIANAAGPVMAIYLLMMRLPKEEYMGTCTMFFLILNWIKLPIFIFEGRIQTGSLLLDLPMIPVLLLGAAAGIWFLKSIRQSAFNTIIHCVVILSAIWLIVNNLH